ncbi:MAG: 2-C-methyl-D-erythritol 2,4-cyclodiphosphate synthase [Candidatus Kaelpia aquatica]|nr:2-C-methyl-D-erythritol 2,4-cyclodiphosphate synthase [Candidatus Kaelpia aquatica]
MQIKIGFGFDSHGLEKGDKIKLGGVEIESDFKLKGFSDGDLIMHALSDAILGALSHKDIGELFPDTDSSNKGRDSADFLKQVKELMLSKNYNLSNIDITVVIERPHLSPYKDRIRENIAEILELDNDLVSVKAKHTEEAFSTNTAVCFVVVLLMKA